MNASLPLSVWQRVGRCLLSLFTLIFVAQAGQATLLDDIYNIVNTVSIRVADIQSKTNSTRTTVFSVQDRVQQLKDQTDELMGRVRSGADALSDEIIADIEEAIVDIQDGLTEFREGRAEFIANEVSTFRPELLDFIGNVELLLNQLAGMRETELPNDFELARLRNLVSSAPDRALFPIARGMQALDFAKLNGTLEDVILEFLEVKTLLLPVENEQISTLSSGNVGTLAQNGLCDRIQNPERVDRAAKILKISGVILKFTGEVIKGVGEQTTSKDIGFHGYIHITLETNAVKTVGTILAGLGEAVASVSEFVMATRADCEVLARHAALLDRIASFEAIDLRIAIESHLSGSGKQLAVFFLPAGEGGLLEKVRDIVENTLSLGGVGGAEAQAYFNAGQSAYGLGNYREAYESYRQAYLEATQWTVPLQISQSESEGQYLLSWDSVNGGDYAVESSQALKDWQDVYLIVNGEDGTAELKHVPAGSTEFYRVIRTDR